MQEKAKSSKIFPSNPSSLIYLPIKGPQGDMHKNNNITNNITAAIQRYQREEWINQNLEIDGPLRKLQTISVF